MLKHFGEKPHLNEHSVLQMKGWSYSDAPLGEEDGKFF